MIDALLILAAMIGIAAAAFLVARSPSFWIGLVITVARQALPKLKLAWEAYKATKTPEEWRELREQRERERRGDR